VEENLKIQDFKIILEEKFNINKEYIILMNKNNDFIYEKTIKENKVNDEEILILINTEEEKEEFFHKCCNILYKKKIYVQQKQFFFVNYVKKNIVQIVMNFI
jgi:hypothetical protein